MTDDKTLKAKRIIASLLADKIFYGWENLTHSHVMERLYKYNSELSLGINPPAVLQTMIREGIVHENGTYEGESIYSLKKAKELINI
jgi:hypothetical protein